MGKMKWEKMTKEEQKEHIEKMIAGRKAKKEEIDFVQ